MSLPQFSDIKVLSNVEISDAIIQADEESLLAVDEIGVRIAASVRTFFENPVNRDVVDRLERYGLQCAIDETSQEAGSNQLDGLIFVVSGVFEKYSRDELKGLIDQHGGKLTGSLSSKTNYLVAGANMGPSKKAKAENLGIPIINENDFAEMLSS